MKTADRGTWYKLALIWLAILLVSSFWMSVRSTSDPIVMAVLPETPREGEPIVATFKLNNPTSEPLLTSYQFYANGVLLRDGTTTIAPNSSKTYSHTYENSLPLGEQLNFVVNTQSEEGDFQKVLSTPAYPPQIWSSFVSFASFSTSVMSSMSTMAYYQNSFGNNAFSVGLVTSIVLIILLIFLELPFAPVRAKSVVIMGRLRVRLSTMAWILLIITLGMIYTKVVMILSM